MDRERNESGQYTEQITEERVLKALGKGTGSAIVLSAQQVADKLGCTRQGADHKLRELEKEGKVLKHDLGSRSVAWTRRRARR